MEPDLDALLQEETDAFEKLNQAYIRFSMARSNVVKRLKEIHEDHPTLFNHKDNI